MMSNFKPDVIISIGGDLEDEKIELLTNAIDGLKDKANIPKTISEAGVSKERFYKTLDKMCEEAFDDQCTGVNPRYPLIGEIR